ncbi:MAG: galactokinase [Acidobacteria bacterium]|nr:galactokinase [Acidobacteriota bacterium]
MVDRQALQQKFLEMFGSPPRLFRAPGRVNLIGEHTDYNDGFVLPMAIDRSTFVAAAPRSDRLVRVCSLDFNERYAFDLDDAERQSQAPWLDYVEGVARSLEACGVTLKGADLLIQSEVPIGGGLSSSAALEISAGLALLSLSEVAIDRVQLAQAGQRAEHDYVGANIGLMDQMAAALAHRGYALFLDCRTLETADIAIDTQTTAVIVCDSNVKHALASSEYNKRREECEIGVAILKKELPQITALRDVRMKDFQRYQEQLPEVIRRRCRHVISENARTLEAAQMLRQHNLAAFGQLMLQSHQSLRDDYEVSSSELDALVEIARQLPGLIGARMTGGGFGGCTVNFVEPFAVEHFCNTLATRYQQVTKRTATLYHIHSGDGAEELKD